MANQQVALVTGAGRGIGRAIALALAKEGWRVGVNFRSDTSSATETMAAIDGEKMLLQADVADPADRKRLVSELLAAWGRIDLLVNNAGIAPRQRMDLLEMSETGYDEVMAVNLKGPLFLTQRVAKVMIELRACGVIDQARIINISSISAYTSSVNRGEYCISKAGLAMVTALFADRLAGHNIHVYEIRPGVIQTDMTRSVSDRYDRLFAEGLTPIRRWGQPEDVARAVVAIAKGYLPYSTGEVINVDGGFHLHRL